MPGIRSVSSIRLLGFKRPNAPTAQPQHCRAMRFMKTREMRKIFQGVLALVKLNRRMQLAQSCLLVFHSVNERTRLILIIISLKHLKSLEYDNIPAGAGKCFAIRSALSPFYPWMRREIVYNVQKLSPFELTC